MLFANLDLALTFLTTESHAMLIAMLALLEILALEDDAFLEIRLFATTPSNARSLTAILLLESAKLRMFRTILTTLATMKTYVRLTIDALMDNALEKLIPLLPTTRMELVDPYLLLLMETLKTRAQQLQLQITLQLSSLLQELLL